MKVKKIRIYCGIEGIYGDIISYTPVVKWLKDMMPDSYLIFGISQRCSKIKELLERDPLIDEVYVHKYAETGKYSQAELDKRATCDFVFENKVDHHSIDWPAYRDATQEWAYLQGLRIPKGLKPRLFPQEWRNIRVIPNSLVWGIDTPCPTRSWRKRYWDILISDVFNTRLLKHNLEIKMQMLDIKVKGEYKYTFEEMVYLIQQAKYIVTTNAVGMWIASAFETPCIVLLGNEYTPLVPPPPNPNAIYIEKMDVKDITPQEVKDAIRRLK